MLGHFEGITEIRAKVFIEAISDEGQLLVF